MNPNNIGREVRLSVGTVGQGGKNDYWDVWTVQKLLRAAGVSVSVDGRYKPGGDTATALIKFQEKWNDAVGEEFGLRAANKRDPLTLLQPDDDWLLRMAAAAQILIPIPLLNDCAGFFQLHDWLRDSGITYEPKVDYSGDKGRSFWSIHGRPDLAIQLQCGKGAGYINPGPIQINCTTYANIMLSVYLWGNISNGQYKADVHNVGGGSSWHLSKERYSFELIKTEGKDKDGKPKGLDHFTSPEQILGVVDDWEIYSMEIGSDVGHGTGHHAILHNKRVYESRDAWGGPSATDSKLDEFFERLSKWARWIYLFGQS